MASWLKQSTSVDVGIGPFLDETDGKTAETALTITQPDIRLKKGNGNWAQKNAAQTLSHEENGWYELTLDATDTNTLGLLIVAIHESGALPVWKEYMVVPAMIYDSIVAGSDRLDANATHLADQAITASGGVTFPAATLASTTNITAAAGCAVSSIGNNVITAASINADAITAAKIADGAIDAATFAANAITSTVVADNTITAAKIASNAITSAKVATDAIGAAQLAADAVSEIQSGLATAAALATVDGIVDDILLDTAEIGAAGAGLTALASAANLATVDTVVDAIKVKTDSLTFTQAGQVDANVQYVNDIQVNGTGAPGDEWGP